MLYIIFITQVFFWNTIFAKDVVISNPSLEDIISSVQKKTFIERDSGKNHPKIDRTKPMDVICTKSFKSNLRKGPGPDFPLSHQILINNYPLKVIKYVETWYAVEDFEGTIAWISRVNIKSHCGAIVKNAGLAKAYFFPNKNSKVIMSLERGFIIKEVECEAEDWCRIKINNQTAWIQKKDLWGNI